MQYQLQSGGKNVTFCLSFFLTEFMDYKREVKDIKRNI